MPGAVTRGGPEPAEWAGVRREHRVGEHGGRADSDQYRGVADVGEARRAIGQGRGERRERVRRDVTRPRASRRRRPPAEQLDEAAIGVGFRIEELLALDVEVIGGPLRARRRSVRRRDAVHRSFIRGSSARRPGHHPCLVRRVVPSTRSRVRYRIGYRDGDRCRRGGGSAGSCRSGSSGVRSRTRSTADTCRRRCARGRTSGFRA